MFIRIQVWPDAEDRIDADATEAEWVTETGSFPVACDEMIRIETFLRRRGHLPVEDVEDEEEDDGELEVEDLI